MEKRSRERLRTYVNYDLRGVPSTVLGFRFLHNVFPTTDWEGEVVVSSSGDGRVPGPVVNWVGVSTQDTHVHKRSSETF